MGGKWVIEVDETNRRMTGCRRCEGETKLTAGWLDDEVLVLELAEVVDVVVRVVVEVELVQPW